LDPLFSPQRGTRVNQMAGYTPTADAIAWAVSCWQIIRSCWIQSAAI
jgi:hypothetical protein